MKLVKKIITLIFIATTLTACDIKKENMEDIKIYYTTYPIKYILTKLYGDYSTIQSIYPTGVNVDEYQLSERKLIEYSKGDLFVFNSLDKDRDYAVKMINSNEKLKIIDSALGMTTENNLKELWLNPYNYLMMAENIKKGLNEYINNPYRNEEIENNFKKLEYDVSKLDSSITEAINESKYKTIVTDSNALKFLEKYGLTVISLEETEDLSENTINEVKNLISTKNATYIYILDKEPNNTIKKIQEETNVEVVKLNDMHSIDGNIENANEDYITIMTENMNLIKRELYK